MYSESEAPALYLASASPRRSELLQQIGVPHQQFGCHVDERPRADETPQAYVQRVTQDKLLAGLEQAPEQAVVLAADTVVVLDGRILGKPADEREAKAVLADLSGRDHQVMTAVAVGQGATQLLQQVNSRVFFRPLSEAEIAAYWASGEPADKAGSYAIQGLGAVFVQRIEGSYSAVVGLPLLETAALLARFGVKAWQLS